MEENKGKFKAATIDGLISELKRLISMVATGESLMVELEKLIREKQIDNAIEFLEKNKEEFKRVSRLAVKENVQFLCLNLLQEWAPSLPPLEAWDSFLTLSFLWEMKSREYDNYSQWLPQEMFEDTVILPLARCLHLSRCLPLFGLLLECNLVDIRPEWGPFKKVYLWYAVHTNNEPMVRLLLEKGVEINVKSKHGETALNIALRNRNVAIALLLLNNGAYVGNAENGYGETALEIAVKNQDVPMAGSLLGKGADVNAKNSYGETALEIAVKNQDVPMAGLLLEKGADVNAKNKYKSTPLHLAAKKDKSIAELLLNNNANVNTQNFGGETPLYIAVKEGNKPTASLLLEKGANANTKNFEGEAPLHIAVNKVDEPMVSLLLNNGADVNALNSDGDTALDIAVNKVDEPMVSLLLNNGADVKARNSFQQTALQTALDPALRYTEMSHIAISSIEKLLRDRGAAEVYEGGEDDAIIIYLGEEEENQSTADLLQDKEEENQSTLLQNAASTLPQTASELSSNSYSFYGNPNPGPSSAPEANPHTRQTQVENFGLGASK